MSSSSGKHSGGCSPLSHIDMGNMSPLILKPTTHMTQRQRSSSINSITSNHSGINTSNLSTNNARSMSIVSLDSPRNSIGSIEDTALKITRKGSTSSLTSLTNVPALSPVDCVISRRIGSSSRGEEALLSDEDSDLDYSKPAIKTLLKPHLIHAHEKNSGRQVASLKQDYKFKFDKIIPSSSHKKDYQDNSPSPLSTISNDSGRNVRKREGELETKTKNILTALNEKDTAKHVKKVKQIESMPQTSLLKKKSIFSKDLQLELMSTTSNYSSNELVQTKFVKNHLPSKGPNNQMDITSFSEKNKMIHKLNQKWNKSSIGMINTEQIKSRKRSRSLLSDYEDISDITA